MKLLNTLKPLMYLVPEIIYPDHKQPFQERLIWTGLALLLFLVMNHLPLYGTTPSKSNWDAFYIQRSILGSNRGTLMELGLSPILTSGLLMQFITGARLLEVNQSLKEDRTLLAGAQKLLCISIAVIEAILFVSSGMSGAGVLAEGAPPAGPYSMLITGSLIVFQLVTANSVLMALDEMLQRGYGVGSGASLFMCTSVCSHIVWNTVSPITRDLGFGSEFVGALWALPHLLWSRPNKLLAIGSGLFRSHLPNLWSVLVVVAVGAATLFLQGWRVDIPVKYQMHRSGSGNFPVKMFYTSNIPLVLTAVLVGNVTFLSQVLSCAFPTSFLSSLVGVWRPDDLDPLVHVPVAGLAYLLSPPPSVLELFWDPFHTVFYVSFVLSTCAIFSKAWTEVSGTNPKGVARTLREQNMIIKGHRDSSLEHELSRYIPTAAAFGGVVVGGLAVGADLLGAAGNGSATLLAVTTILQLYEIVSRELGGTGLGLNNAE